MKNKDLIKQLQEYDLESEVMIEENHCDLIYGIVEFPAFPISKIHMEDKIIRIRVK